jgi:hypothetical protein
VRLSTVVVVSILYVSVTAFAQHSSGGGSSGGHSGGGSSSSSSSSHSSSTSSSSHSTSHSTSSSRSSASESSSSAPSSAKDAARTASAKSEIKSRNAKRESLTPGNAKSANATPEKRRFFSFLRSRKPVPKPATTAKFPPFPCKKGMNCPVCPGGTRGARGQCVSEAPVSCSAGLVWNGFGCGVQSRLGNCQALADQLEAERQQMQGQVDPAESLRYRMLREQYERCMRRYGLQPFTSYAVSDEGLFGSP